MFGTYSSWLPGDARGFRNRDHRIHSSGDYNVLVVSVSACHVHVLAQLPVDLAEYRKVIAWLKTRSSRAMKDVLPGRVGSRGDKHILVKGDRHRACEYDYIRDRQGPSARCWCEGEAFD